MKYPGKIISYGLLLFLVWLLSSYVSALATGTQGQGPPEVDFNSRPLVISGVSIALLMAGAAYWFSRNLHLPTKRDALITSVWWIVIVVALQILVMWPYQTTPALFSAWAMYFPYLGIVSAATLGVQKTNPVSTQNPYP
ncbi:MAG: hypothetical protein HYY50_02665 [Candidatus Kerfeldbacteria bacterium]|nr:hypothetical protein [Candidatus Kerfeldbacteria bacterium]